MEVKISEMVSGVLKYLDENEEMIVDKTEFGYPATSLTDLVAEVLPDVAERTVAEAERGDIDEWLEMEGDFEWVSRARERWSFLKIFFVSRCSV